MASLQTRTVTRDTTHRHGKLSKSRNPTVVKPILKRLQSHSERNSLNLDRSWEDQNPHGAFASSGYRDDVKAANTPSYGVAGPPDSGGAGLGLTAAGVGGTGPDGTRGSRDLATPLTATAFASFSQSDNRTRISHGRSTSGASHASITTTASGRHGSFVHPFQQTPRASSPPLSYANAAAAIDNVPRVSPANHEYDLDFDSPDCRPPTCCHSHLATHHTKSLSDPPKPATGYTCESNSSQGRDMPRSAARQAQDQQQQNSPEPSLSDSPVPSMTTGPTVPSPQMTATPSSASLSHMPTLRSSLDRSGFRLRSRSEVEAVTRQEQVRQARRKFEEKEKAKDEKYAREQVRKRERADTKEAQRHERVNGHHRKSSLGGGRLSMSMDKRASRKSTEIGASGGSGATERTGLTIHERWHAPSKATLNTRADDVRFDPAEKRTAKRKTTGAWTAFVLWLRTRLLKIGRHRGDRSTKSHF